MTLQTYAIADFSLFDRAVALRRIANLFECGIDFLQIRAKQLSDRRLLQLTEDALRLRSSECRTRVLLNGRPDIALAGGLDGVHLPASGVTAAAARSVGRLLVGRSCHTVSDVRDAASEEVDYALLGPVFAPRSKHGEVSLSREELVSAAATGIPLYLLGGISTANIGELADLPIAGIAAVTLFMIDEPVENVLRLVRTL